MSETDTRIPEGAESVSIAGFNQYIGPIYRLSVDPDGMGARFGFIVAPKHMNSAGSVHGGMLMAFADVAMSGTSRLGAPRNEPPKAGGTVSLTADFVGPGRLDDFIEAKVRVTRRTRTIAFLSADVFCADRPILVATGLWKIG
jgi:acyl-coenzyme A thioesterase PaaI-like protein